MGEMNKIGDNPRRKANGNNTEAVNMPPHHYETSRR